MKHTINKTHLHARKHNRLIKKGLICIFLRYLYASQQCVGGKDKHQFLRFITEVRLLTVALLMFFCILPPNLT